MGQLVLLVVAAAWAAVLVPPLLRSRLENRPNSSVTDFRNQLSSLQRAMPRGGMRTMARPLAPSPLSRPAAPGRPVLRSGVRTHGPARQPAHQSSRSARAETASPRMYDASLRSRSHTQRTRTHRAVAPGEGRRQLSAREAMKRRRANTLFVLVLVSGCALFLAATTRAEAMLYTFVLAFMGLCGYVYLLGQMRQREQPSAQIIRAPVRHQADSAYRHAV
jgi:hypothetical protein